MRKWIPAVAIIAFVAAGFFLIRPAPKLGSFTMSDGTVVEVAKVTTGSIHRFRYDNRWQDLLGYVLPKRIGGGLDPHVLEFTTTNAHSLIIWTKAHGRPPRSYGFEIAVADESGVEVPVESSASIQIKGGFLRNLVCANGWLITPLPKHAREIELGFYDRKGRLGHLKLPNPAYRLAQDAQPESLPVAKPAGDVQVRLANISAVKNPENTNRADWSISAEVVKEGAVDSDWRLDGLEVLADGELFFERGPDWWLQTIGSFPPSGGEEPLSPFRGPWPDAVWTLRLWAGRQTNFAPAEIWVINDVPLASTTDWRIDKHEQRQVGGKTVELRGFRGPNAYHSSTGSSNIVCVEFAAPPRREGVRITFLSARDDQGRPLGLASRGSGGSGQPRISYSFSVRHQSDAKAVTFQFAIHQARSVDFLVRPTFNK